MHALGRRTTALPVPTTLLPVVPLVAAKPAEPTPPCLAVDDPAPHFPSGGPPHELAE